MKKIVSFICVVFFALSFMNAQTAKEIRKERTEISRLSKSELNEKASKAARRAAKNYTRERWETVPGALPIEKQLDKSYMM